VTTHAPVRIAVVGYGHFGRRHAEKVVELARTDPQVSLVGVADRDAGRARRAAQRTGARGVTDAAALFPAADAAIVAVPSVDHYAVVRAALQAGLDVLVEKPMAMVLGQAEALVALARRRGRVLQVGHQEWFNPALRAVRDKVRAPRFVEAHRVGPFVDRASDVDVVRDLMIHDLDIVQQLLGEEPERVDAIGVPVITDTVDIANARLVFPGGCVASLTASRVAQAPARRIRLFERDAAFSLDFLAQSALIHQRVSPRPDAKRWRRVQLEELKGPMQDTLLAQLAAFVRAVRARQGDAPAGIGALRTALRVVEAMPLAPRR
jgi:predicted dehydrogenase